MVEEKTSEELHELFEERAAIMEHDGEMTRYEAERLARIDVYGQKGDDVPK